MSDDATRPFHGNSISLGLHLGEGDTTADKIDQMLREAVLAETFGFDGVTISEHHLGMPMYVPQPLLVANWILSETRRIWSGAAPMLLTLSDPRVVAEQVAWMSARFPGRVGLAVGSGARAEDFDGLGRDFETRFKDFDNSLQVLAACVRADGPLGEDWAIGEGCLERVPILCAAMTPKGIDLAIRSGFGVTIAGDLERIQRLVARYHAAGGTGPVRTMRRVWVGQAPAGALDALDQAYRHSGLDHRGSAFGAYGPPGQVAEEIARFMKEGSLTCVNVRPHFPGVSPSEIAEQIQAFGELVIPRLRELFAQG